MPAYVVVQVEVTDEAQYATYKDLAADAVKKYGGQYIVRGGQKWDLEGKNPYGRIVLLRFDSVDQARTWYNSAEYQAAKAARSGAATGLFTLAEGVESA